MKAVNTELMSEAEPSELLRIGDAGFAAGVAKLFGTSDANVRRAVEEFLDKSPASFDHHRLRIVAAAARVFEDKNHVAHMIRRLRPTGLDIAAKPIDLDTARRQFETCLPDRYRPETRRALVLDLVHKMTLEMLDHCPPKRISEPGSEMLRELNQKLARGTAQDLYRALNSRFADEKLVGEVLDRIEAKIVRTERERNEDAGSAEAELLDSNELALVFNHLISRKDTLASREAHLERAWQLYERCAPHFDVLARASESPELLATRGRSVLEAIDAFESAHRDRDQATRVLRARMLSVSALPEDVARDIVTTRDLMISGFDSADTVDARLAHYRVLHYSRGGALLAPVSNDDLDMVVVSLRLADVTPRLVNRVESEEVLDVLVDQSSEMGILAVTSLLNHPKLTPAAFDRLVEMVVSETPLHGWEMSPLMAELLLHPRIDDERLAATMNDLVTTRNPTRLRLGLCLQVAACNPNSGAHVYAMVERYCSAEPGVRNEMLDVIAINSPSARLQTVLAETAELTDDRRLATHLMRNGMLRKGTWDRLARRFGPVSSDEVMLKASFSSTKRQYGPNDIAELVISGDAAPGRAEAVIRDSLYGESSGIAERLPHSDLVSDEMILGLTEDADMHVALAAATHPRAGTLDAESRLVLPVERRLRETTHAIEHGLGEMPPDKKLNSWDKMPNRDDETLELTQLHHLLDRQVVDGLTITVPRTRRELLDLSREMHNCLDGYVDDVADGKQIVVVARDGDDVHAASISVKRKVSLVTDEARLVDSEETVEVKLTHVNSKFNDSNKVPPAFKAGLAEMVERVNSGTLQPVEAPFEVHDEIASAAEQSLDEGPEPERSTVVRQRRKRIPPLQGDAGRQSEDVHSKRLGPDAPSLLSPSSDEPAPALDDLQEPGSGVADQLPAAGSVDERGFDGL